ncbi:hypothetical protein [Sphingomonas hankookensis]|uniref:hypothetical protein n=1 Tax=Sphingomonas hankookensis TaxID=563996 RepID=UPI003F799FB2
MPLTSRIERTVGQRTRLPRQPLRQHLPAPALGDAPAGGARGIGRGAGDVDADAVHLERARSVDGGDAPCCATTAPAATAASATAARMRRGRDKVMRAF